MIAKLVEGIVSWLVGARCEVCNARTFGVHCALCGDHHGPGDLGCFQIDLPSLRAALQAAADAAPGPKSLFATAERPRSDGLETAERGPPRSTTRHDGVAEMNRTGKAVKFVDREGVEHDALVTADWGGGNPTSSLNLVYVTKDASKTDQYGSQIQRETSVVHQSQQNAPGFYWHE